MAALRAFGDRPAVLTLKGNEVYSLCYKELSDRIGRLTAGLIAAGAGAGQRTAILAPNSPDWIIACLAIVNAGGVAVPLDAKLDEESLRHVLADSKPSLIFATTDVRERVERIASHRIRTVCLDGDADGSGDWQDLTGPDTAVLPDLKAEDTAAIFYTSGTTGPPKGVPLTHRNLLFELQSLIDMGLMSPGERLLLPLPLHHVYPFVVGMLAALVYGVGIILPQSITGPHILQAIKSCGASTIIGVPRLYEAMLSGIDGRIAARGWAVRLIYRALQNASLFARRRLSLRLGSYLFRPLHQEIGPQLRLLACGGAALDQQVAWTLECLGWTVATGYGLTETSPLLTIVPPGDTRFETAGRPIPGVELRVIPIKDLREEDSVNATEPAAPASRHVEPRAQGIGEIQAKGPNVFAGYLNLPQRTADAFTEDAWFRTGDRGWIDDEGFLHVLGRDSTFVVTSAGENISLENLERAYEHHPLIKEIGIVMRDRRLVAVAVPEPSELRKAGAKSPDDALRGAVQEQSRLLPSYERVEELAVSHEAIARTRLGKIRRDKLHQRFDVIRAAEKVGAEAVAPMPIEDMSGEDQALLEHPQSREVWALLAKRYPAISLSPDSDVTLDLGIDSLEWINVTLEIREHTGINLSEQATARIQTVRDLLNEVLGSSDRVREHIADLGKEPELFLSAQQKSWLKPLGPIESLVARLLYHVNRTLVRTIFRVKVSGLEHLRSCDQMILTPNHVSVLDPFVIAAVVPYDVLRRSAFAGWTGMAFANPLYRFVVRLARTFPVEVGRAAFSSLALGLVTLRRGMNLIWFPEGRRSRDGKLQVFRPGIGVILAKHPLPVVPAVISGTFEAMPIGQRFPRPRRVEVRFGHVCRPEDLERKGRGDRTEDRMTEALHRKMEELQHHRDT